MVNNQLADSINRSGAFGLAKSLQAQLVHPGVAPQAGAWRRQGALEKRQIKSATPNVQPENVSKH